MTKRGIATITIYVYGDTDQDKFNDGQEIVKHINDKFDCRATIEQLHNAPFGEIGSAKEIDLNTIKR